MAKPIFKIKEMAADKIAAIRKAIKNTLTDDAAELGNALRTLLDELENSEVEVDYEALKAQILEIVNKNEEVPEVVANAIANKLKAVENAVNNGNRELPIKIKNAVAAAILRSENKNTVEGNVNAVLVENGITGYTFGDVVDFAVVDNWGNLNPIFAKLHKTFFTKFFYNDDELKTAALLAKQWDKAGTAEKAIQELEVTGKSITTKYVYKRQQAAQEDLDEIEKAGELANFLSWIDEELDRMIANTCIMAIFVGDTTNAVGKRVTTFEAIGTKSQSDVFTSVLDTAATTGATLSDLRRLADSVKNPNGKEKVMYMNSTTLSEVAKFIYAENGSEFYHTTEEVAKMIGVDAIVTTDLLGTGSAPVAICMLPDGYWVNEKNAISVAYPTYEKNVVNYQKERNIGGGIHDLYSTAVLNLATA